MSFGLITLVFIPPHKEEIQSVTPAMNNTRGVYNRNGGIDEIMNFIIEADPEEVNLLFRRPRKETLQARIGIKKPSQANTSVAKWVDDDVRHKKKTPRLKRNRENRTKNLRGKKKTKIRLLRMMMIIAGDLAKKIAVANLRTNRNRFLIF